MTTFRWTDQIHERLRQLWNQDGLSANGCTDALSRELGVKLTRSAVMGRIHRSDGFVKRDSPINQAAAAPKKATPKRRSRPRPIPSNEIPSGGGVPLIDARENQCRWPVSGEGMHLRVCGEYRSIESPHSYCDRHAKVAYVPTRRRAA